jgi:hypothetical protein
MLNLNALSAAETATLPEGEWFDKKNASLKGERFIERRALH